MLFSQVAAVARACAAAAIPRISLSAHRLGALLHKSSTDSCTTMVSPRDPRLPGRGGAASPPWADQGKSLPWPVRPPPYGGLLSQVVGQGLGYVPLVPELCFAPRLAWPRIPGHAARSGATDPGLALWCPVFHRPMRCRVAESDGRCLHGCAPPRRAGYAGPSSQLTGFKRGPVPRQKVRAYQFAGDEAGRAPVITLAGW